MSIDLHTIIGHQLSSKEVISFPSLLNENLQLKQFYIEKQKINLSQNLPESFLKKIQEDVSWETITEEYLINSWINNETPELLDENGYINCTLNTYFGFVTFNRNTITILFFPEHKYANLHYENERSFIFEFSDKLAQLLGQDKIIYCSDTFSTEKIESWSYDGFSIDKIEEMAIEKFGALPNSIEQAIENRFFIQYLKK